LGKKKKTKGGRLRTGRQSSIAHQNALHLQRGAISSKSAGIKIDQAKKKSSTFQAEKMLDRTPTERKSPEPIKKTNTGGRRKKKP